MQRNWLIILLAGLLPAAAWGQTSAIPSLPNTPLPAVHVGEPVVLVLPLAQPGNASTASEVNSIQRDMAADLTQMIRARVIAPTDARPAGDDREALDEGQRFNASYVVYGTWQQAGDQMRVTGQVLDVAAGRSLAALKATAPLDNLFPLEDSLAAQAAGALPAPIGIPTAPQTQPAEASAGYAPQPLPTNVDEARAEVQPPATQPYYTITSDASNAQVNAPANAPASSGLFASAPPANDGSPYYSYTESLPPTYYTYNTYYYPSYPYTYWGYPYYWGGIGIGLGYYGGFHHYGWYGRPFGYGHGYYGGRGFVGHAFGGGRIGAAHSFGGGRGFAGHGGGGGRR
jgi:TolB-like protein